MHRLLFGLLVFLHVAGCSGCRHAGSSTSTAPSASSDDGEIGRIHWEQHVTGGASAADRLPMIVGMHGLGGDPAKFGPRVFEGFNGRARIVLLRGPDHFNYGYAWWLPNEELMRDGPLEGEKTGRALEAIADETAGVIAELTHRFPTAGAPILVGFSQGGAMSYAIATRHPELVSAAYPLSGWLPPRMRAPAVDAGALPPIFAFHGTADPIVPFAVDQATVNALKADGFSVEFTPLEYEKHTLPPGERAEIQHRLLARISELK